jgi:hypothetical protein
MAKARSPGYPSIGLKEAIERIEADWKQAYQNKISRPVLATHMGYSGLSGKSLGVLSSLGKFGLLEGRGEENWVSDLAVSILAHPPKTKERAEAITAAASMPDLFSDIDKRFQNGNASDQAIRSWLIMQKFLPQAADAVIRSYRETKQLVEDETEGCDSGQPGREGPMVSQEPIPLVQSEQPRQTNPAAPITPLIIEGTRKAIFALTEGDVMITFPEELSPESVEDLAEYLEIFLKKARREAGLPTKNKPAA